jgi:hypothetical protein
MVKSGSADLKFINDTHNPIIIKAFADGDKLRMEIYGQPLTVKYARQSIVTGEISAPIEQEVIDDKGEYPTLYQGERMFLRYSKVGLTSQGFLVATKNDKVVSIKKIREDKYNAQRGLVVIGTAQKPSDIIDQIPSDIVEDNIDPEFTYPNL